MWAHYYGTNQRERVRHDSLTSRYGTEDTTDARQDDFSQLMQPALSVCAATTTAYLYPWLSPDSARWAAARTYDEGVLLPFQRRECATFKRSVPRGQAVMLDSGHYVYINREVDVVRVVRRFLDSLQ